MSRLLLLTSLALSACGVTETATVAATTAKLQAEQAKSAQQMQQKILSDLERANQAAQERALAAEKTQ